VGTVADASWLRYEPSVSSTLTRNSLTLILTALCFAGCPARDHGDPRSGNPAQNDAAGGARPGDAGVAHAGGTVLPDGAVLGPDGAVLRPDVAIDGGIHGHDVGPFCRADDAGLAPIPDACVSGACFSKQCTNGVKDPYESDVDCGNGCKPCAARQHCGDANDCANQACSARFCEDNDIWCDQAECLPTAPVAASQIALTVNAIVRNPQDGVVFAALGAQPGGAPGSLAAFAPGETTPSYTILLPGEGGALAITDDAKKLYVAIGGSTPSVARIDLASRTLETPFVLGKNSSGSTLYAAYLAPVPGHPELIGIVHATVGSAVGSEGLYLYRDGVRVHPNQKKWQTNTDYVFLNVTAAVFTSDTRAYALNGASTGFDFSTVDITPAELRVSSVRKSILDDFNILPVLKDGKLFIGDRVVDPAAPRVLGDVRSIGAVAVDDTGSHAYYTVFDDATRRIGVECFDTKTYARTGAIVLDVMLPESVHSAFAQPQLMLWGGDGLAIKVDNMGATKLLLMPNALRGVPGCQPSVAPTPPVLLSAPDARDAFVQTYCLHVADVAYAPASHTVYATVNELDARYANRLAALPVGAGGLAFATAVGSDPGPLSVSDDASTAWVGLRKAGYLLSVDLNNPAAVQQFATPLAPPDQNAVYALDLALLPGSKDTLAVTGDALGIVPLNVYERGVPRYADMAGAAGADPLRTHSVVVADASRVYIGGALQMSAVDLSASGRTVAWTMPTKVGPLQLAAGKVFDGTTLVDPAQQRLLGGIPEEQQPAATAALAPDGLHAYRAHFAAASPPGKTRVEVQCFDLRSFGQSGGLVLDLPDPQSCTRAGAIRVGMIGDSGLTFASDSALVIAPDVLNCVAGCSTGATPPVYLPPSVPDKRDATGKVVAYTDVAVQDIEHDAKSGLLFVSLGDIDPRAPNHVLALDANGALKYALQVGRNPGPLANSADGSKLYVGLTGAAQIVTVELASHAVTPFQQLAQQPTLSGPSAYPAPTDIEVVPGVTDTLAVSLVQQGSSLPLAPVLVRPGSVENLFGASALSVAALLPIDARVTWLASSFLTKVTRESDGTASSEFNQGVRGFLRQLVPVGSDRFATNTGAIVDGQTGMVLGMLSKEGGIIASDDGKKLYVISQNSSSYTLTCFDAANAQQTGTTTFSLPEGSGLGPNGFEIDLLGARGLAVRSIRWEGLTSLVLLPGLLDTVTGC